MSFLNLLFPALLIFSASAVSNGNLLTCNVDMAIGVGTPVMKWVQAPVNSSKYTITSPAGTYTPGGLTPITVTVLDLDYVYIGMLLVALVNNTVAGQWTVLDGDDFFLPATCKFRSVVHSNADLKPIVQTFYWKGDVGTGPVTFRALIKQGEQNHGNFYKPNNLVLTESPTAAPAQTVWKGEPGASCDETCGKQNMACDSTGTLGLKTPALLQTAVAGSYACREPFLVACAPPATGANSYCFAYNCTGTQTFNTAKTCSHRSSDPTMNQKFCKCKAGATIRDPAIPTSPANLTLGYRLAAPLQLDAELTLNAIEIQGGNVTIDITGPQDRWFAIGWDASYMSGAYATVVSLRNPAVGIPQNYERISDKGYADSDQGWYDIRCQQALNDYCRNVGASATRYFSCAMSNTTAQGTANNTYLAINASRVPCKGGKIAPFQPMTVAEFVLSDSPRNATRLVDSTELKRSLVDGGRFHVVFSRPLAGSPPFPNKKTMNLIWSIGVNQYFGVSSSYFNKHSKKSETQVTLNLVPIYGTCPTRTPTRTPTTQTPTQPGATFTPTSRSPTTPGTTLSPTTTPGTQLSPAVSQLPSLWVLAGLTALGTKNWMWGALLAVLLQPVSAHNWMNSPSRAQIAAVNIPCQARVDPAPHLQVVPGQKFQLEWSTGHGDTSTVWTYFVFLKEDDYAKLVDVTDSMLDDYLAKAPSYVSGVEWTRRHLSPWANYAAGCKDCNNGSLIPGTFSEVVFSNNSKYVVRDPIAIAKSLRYYDKNVTQFWYPADSLSGDSRAQYKSAKYPWILSVHKFRIAAHWPNEYDMATFSFPTGLATGNYIVHFKWGGYRDCTDVHVMVGPTPVSLLWGQTGANITSTFARLDHCEYTFVRNPSTRCTKMTNGNASQCLADCLKNGGCTGVQAVRKANPVGTLPYTPNYPYKLYTQNDTAFLFFPPPEYGPCDSRTIHKRNPCPDIQPMCNDTVLGTMADSDYLCYGLNPYRDQDFQTVDDYVITTDPQDPGFYSTCWVRLSPGGFLPFPQPKNPPPVWKTGAKCLSCGWLKNYSALSLSTAPDWTQAFTTDYCRDCDISQTECATNLDYIEGGSAGNCTGAIPVGQTCDAQCDRGFRLYGASRVCENGVLTEANQGCVFDSC